MPNLLPMTYMQYIFTHHLDLRCLLNLLSILSLMYTVESEYRNILA